MPLLTLLTYLVIVLCNIFKVKIPSLQSFNLPAKLDSAIFGIMKNA